MRSVKGDENIDIEAKGNKKMTEKAPEAEMESVNLPPAIIDRPDTQVEPLDTQVEPLDTQVEPPDTQVEPPGTQATPQQNNLGKTSGKIPLALRRLASYNSAGLKEK